MGEHKFDVTATVTSTLQCHQRANLSSGSQSSSHACISSLLVLQISSQTSVVVGSPYHAQEQATLDSVSGIRGRFSVTSHTQGRPTQLVFEQVRSVLVAGHQGHVVNSTIPIAPLAHTSGCVLIASDSFYISVVDQKDI